DRHGSRAGPEAMAPTLQLCPQLGEVVDLSIEDPPDGLLGIRHRLVATRQIDDREPAEAETERACIQIAFVVRAAMGNGARHRFHVARHDAAAVSEVELPADSAHIPRPPQRAGVRSRGYGRLAPVHNGASEGCPSRKAADASGTSLQAFASDGANLP